MDTQDPRDRFDVPHRPVTARRIDAWLDHHYRTVQLIHGKICTIFCGSCRRLHDGDCATEAHEGPFAVFREAGGLFSAVPDVFVFDIKIEQVAYQWVPGVGFDAPFPATHWQWKIAVVSKPTLTSTAKRRAAEDVSLRVAALRWLAGGPAEPAERNLESDVMAYLHGLRMREVL